MHNSKMMLVAKWSLLSSTVTYVKADVPSPIVVQADGQCRFSDVKYSQQISCSTGNSMYLRQAKVFKALNYNAISL